MEKLVREELERWDSATSVGGDGHTTRAGSASSRGSSRKGGSKPGSATSRSPRSQPGSSTSVRIGAVSNIILSFSYFVEGPLALSGFFCMGRHFIGIRTIQWRKLAKTG